MLAEQLLFIKPISQTMSEQRERLQVLGAGIFSLLLVLGVARFSYTPLLPLMQQQAGLGVAAAGWLAAINYAGYLSGAIIASQISDLAKRRHHCLADQRPSL